MSNMNTKIAGVCIYKIIIEIAYIFCLSPLFDYSGFTYEFDFFRYALSWGFYFFLIICMLYTNSTSKRKTDIILEIFIYLCVLPALVLYEGNVISMKLIFLGICYWGLMFFYYNIFGHLSLKKSLYANLHIRRVILFIIVFLSIFVVIYICIKYSGFNMAFDLYGVYDQRTEASSYRIPTVIGYVLGASCATIPIIITFLLKGKNYVGVLCLIMIQMLNFGINGLKSTFAMTIVAIGCYFFINTKIIKKIEILFSVFGVVCVVEYFLLRSYYFIDFLLRRVFFVSSQLSFFYLDYFSNHEPDYFQRNLGKFVGLSSKYSNIEYTIGYEYLREDVSANCGLIADAATNLGVIGVFVFPMIVALFLLVLNRCVEHDNEKIYFVSFVYIAYVLNNAAFTTTLLSHGIICIMLVLYILSKTEQCRGKNYKRQVVDTQV